MTEETQAAVEEVEATEGSDVKITIDTDTYTKERNASGQLTQHNGDIVASGLVKLVLGETYAVAADMLNEDEDELRGKYQHLNPGQQRMNLGNRIRGCVNRANKALAKFEATPVKEGEEAGEAPLSGDEVFAAAIEPFNQAIQDRADAADKLAAEKAEKAAAAKAEKEAKEAAKAKAAEEAEEATEE